MISSRQRIPAYEDWFVQKMNTKHKRVTRNSDEKFFMIFSWTHHVMELGCQ
jgi:hypothetical protein